MKIRLQIFLLFVLYRELRAWTSPHSICGDCKPQILYRGHARYPHHHWETFGPCNFAQPTAGRTQPENPTRRPFARVRTDPPLSLSHSIFGGGGGRWRVSGMAVWRAVGARAVLRRLGAAAETAGRCDGGVLLAICSSSGNATSGLGEIL